MLIEKSESFGTLKYNENYTLGAESAPPVVLNALNTHHIWYRGSIVKDINYIGMIQNSGWSYLFTEIRIFGKRFCISGLLLSFKS